MSEPMVPLRELIAAHDKGEVTGLIGKYIPNPVPLRGAVASLPSGKDVLVISESVDSDGEVWCVSLEEIGAEGTWASIAALTFTGERMVLRQDTPGQSETTLDATQSTEAGLLGKWATHPDYGRGIVIGCYDDSDFVKFSHSDDYSSTGSGWDYVSIDLLTFDDKHPEWLETEEDYANAPLGTVVAGESEYAPGHMAAVFVLATSGKWNEDGVVSFATNRELAGVRRRVLRWGYEK